MLWDCRLFGLLMKNDLAHAEPPQCLCPHWLCAVEESFMKRRAQRRHSSVCLRSAQRRDLCEHPAKWLWLNGASSWEFLPIFAS